MIGVKQLPLFILKFCPLAGNYYLCIRYNHICLPLKPNMFIASLDRFWETSAFLPDNNKIKQDIPIPRICKSCYKIPKNLRQVCKVFLRSFWYAYPSFEKKSPSPGESPQKPSEVSASPQTSCSSAFRLKDMHDKILQPKKIFQRDRVSDVVLFGFLSVFGFTFIHLLTTAERKNYAVEGSQCINLSAGMPMNRTFAERLKLLKEKQGVLPCYTIRVEKHQNILLFLKKLLFFF